MTGKAGYRCPYCDFWAMSKRVVERHIREAHPDKAEGDGKKKTGKGEGEKFRTKVLSKMVGDRVIAYLRGGTVLKGKILEITKYEVYMQTDEGAKVCIFKHALDYIIYEE